MEDEVREANHVSTYPGVEGYDAVVVRKESRVDGEIHELVFRKRLGDIIPMVSELEVEVFGTALVFFR